MAAVTPPVGTLGNVLYYLTDMGKTIDDFLIKESQENPPIFGNKHIVAARETSIALNNLRHACEQLGIMESLMEKVTVVVRDQLMELTQIVTILKSRENSMVEDIIERVQRFTSSLNLAAWQPQWRGMSPPIAYVEGNSFNVSFSGAFTYAAKNKGFTLTIPNCTTEIIEGKSDTLPFKITALPNFFPESAKSNYHLFKGILEVDYWGWRAVYKAKYDVWFITYPLTLDIKLLSIQMTAKEIKRLFRSATYTLERKDFKSGIEVVKKQTIWASEGWKIAGSPKFSPNSHQFTKGTIIKENCIDMTLTLPQQGPDQVSACVEFVEAQDVLEEKRTQTTLALPWGESSEFKADRFHLDFSFKGIPYKITHLCEPNDYIKVEKQENNTYKITTLAELKHL